MVLLLLLLLLLLSSRPAAAAGAAAAAAAPGNALCAPRKKAEMFGSKICRERASWTSLAARVAHRAFICWRSDSWRSGLYARCIQSVSLL